MIKNFNDWLNLKEDASTMPGGNSPMTPTLPQPQSPHLPPTSNEQNPKGHTPGQPSEEEILDDLTTSLQKVLQTKLFPALEKNHINKQKAEMLLSAIVNQISQQYGLNLTHAISATKQGMQMGSGAGTPPPMQPQAH